MGFSSSNVCKVKFGGKPNKAQINLQDWMSRAL